MYLTEADTTGEGWRAAADGTRNCTAIWRARLSRPSHHHQHNVIIYGLLTPTHVRTYLNHVEQHLHILTSSQLGCIRLKFS